MVQGRNLGRIQMRQHHTTEVFTPFGSGYVAEAHGSGNLGHEPKTKGSGTKWVVVVGILLFGATTAGAVAALVVVGWLIVLAIVFLSVR